MKPSPRQITRTHDAVRLENRKATRLWVIETTARLVECEVEDVLNALFERCERNNDA